MRSSLAAPVRHQTESLRLSEPRAKSADKMGFGIAKQAAAANTQNLAKTTLPGSGWRSR